MNFGANEVEDILRKMSEKHSYNAVGVWVLSLYGLELQGVLSNRCQENVIGVGIAYDEVYS